MKCPPKVDLTYDAYVELAVILLGVTFGLSKEIYIFNLLSKPSVRQLEFIGLISLEQGRWIKWTFKPKWMLTQPEGSREKVNILQCMAPPFFRLPWNISFLVIFRDLRNTENWRQCMKSKMLLFGDWNSLKYSTPSLSASQHMNQIHCSYRNGVSAFFKSSAV